MDIKIWYTHTIEKYSGIMRKNKILPFARAWMNPVGIMLSEANSTEESEYCTMSLYILNKKRITEKIKFLETESGKWLSGLEDERNRERLVKGYRLSQL